MYNFITFKWGQVSKDLTIRQKRPFFIIIIIKGIRNSLNKGIRLSFYEL